MKLLAEVALMMKRAGYRLGNADVTLIAQRPKIAQYIPAMRAGIAEALCCDIADINIKGTTEEGLGFTGSGEGIAAHAVCILLPKNKATKRI